MSTSTPKPITLNFGLGVDNRSRETKLRAGFARAADNVDISPDAVVTTRDGYTQLVALPNAHSLWAHSALPFALVADSNTLRRLDPNRALTTLVSALAGGDVFYVFAADRVYWSNGVQTGSLRRDPFAAGGFSIEAWGVETPRPSFSAAAVTTGGLHEGRYGVTLTFANAHREEGGAPEPVFVDVAEGGGILLTGISLPSGGSPSELRIYRTDANTPDFMYVQSAAVGTTTVLLGAQLLGRTLTTLLKDVFPAARYLVLKGARIFGAVDKQLVWSDSLYYGLVDTNTNFLRYADPITMIAVPDAPRFVMYVGTLQRTYMLVGDSITNASQVEISQHGVMPGSMAVVPPDAAQLDGITTPVPFWIGSDGLPYAGTENGVMLLHKKFAYPSYDQVAAGFLQTEGNSRYIVSGRESGRASGFTMADSVTATIYNNGGGA